MFKNKTDKIFTFYFNITYEIRSKNKNKVNLIMKYEMKTLIYRMH